MRMADTDSAELCFRRTKLRARQADEAVLPSPIQTQSEIGEPRWAIHGAMLTFWSHSSDTLHSCKRPQSCLFAGRHYITASIIACEIVESFVSKAAESDRERVIVRSNLLRRALQAQVSRKQDLGVNFLNAWSALSAVH